jgi:hypothetical protein
MFSKKYSVTILNGEWSILKKDIKLDVLPRIDEYLYFDDAYYVVLNIVHMLGKKHELYVIVEKKEKK